MSDETLDDIRLDEGWSPRLYKDSRGIWSWGYGFVADPARNPQLPRAVGDFWSSYLVDQIRVALPARWPAYDRQDCAVQSALVQMCYQLGVDGVLGFKIMLAALERGDRETAAVCALDSDWYRQTPARAERLAAMIHECATDR
jgi:lysozyme